MADEQEREEEGLLKRAGRGVASEVGAALTGSTSRQLSSALMSTAFEKFGQAFTDTGFRGRRGGGGQAAGLDPAAMQPWRAAGAKAADALEHRWQLMELEDFKDAHADGFLKAAEIINKNHQSGQTMLDDGQWVGPDGQIVQLDTTSITGQARIDRHRAELTTKFYTELADATQTLMGEVVKYPGNRMIEELGMGAIEAQQKVLQTTANPQQTIEGEQGFATIDKTRRDAQSNAINARTAAADAKELKQPTSLPMALKDERWKDNPIGYLTETPEGMASLSTGIGGDILAGKTATFRAAVIKKDEQIVKDNPKADAEKLAEKGYRGYSEDQALSPEGYAALNSITDQASGELRMRTATDVLQKQHPAAAAKDRAMHPYLYPKAADVAAADDKQVNPLLAPDVIPEGRRSKKEQKGIIDKIHTGIKERLDEELRRWVGDANNPTDVEAALAHMEEWITEHYENQPTTEAANIVKHQSIEKEMKYLRENWSKISDVIKEENADQSSKQRNLRAAQLLKRKRRGPGRGLR